jgi:CRISPR/Cas system CSM-associated protein Csm2 small subunit
MKKVTTKSYRKKELKMNNYEKKCKHDDFAKTIENFSKMRQLIEETKDIVMHEHGDAAHRLVDELNQMSTDLGYMSVRVSKAYVEKMGEDA